MKRSKPMSVAARAKTMTDAVIAGMADSGRVDIGLGYAVEETEIQYYFAGSVKLSGVAITVLAKNQEEARSKAEQGQWEEAEYNTAERTDFYITRETGHE